MDLSATWQAMYRRPFFQNFTYTPCWDDPKPLPIVLRTAARFQRFYTPPGARYL